MELHMGKWPPFKRSRAPTQQTIQLTNQTELAARVGDSLRYGFEVFGSNKDFCFSNSASHRFHSAVSLV
jgi:hypothetical protein